MLYPLPFASTKVEASAVKVERQSSCWKRHTADMTVIHVPIQVFAPLTVMLRVHFLLCRAIATTKAAAPCLQVTRYLGIHVSEHSNICRSNTSALEVL